MCSHRQTKTHQPKLPQWLESVDPWDEGRSVGCLAQSLCCKESLPDVQFRLGSVNVGQLEVTKCEDFLSTGHQSWFTARDKKGLLTTNQHFLTSFIFNQPSPHLQIAREGRRCCASSYKWLIRWKPSWNITKPAASTLKHDEIHIWWNPWRCIGKYCSIGI